jgi:hypothetical protein
MMNEKGPDAREVVPRLANLQLGVIKALWGSEDLFDEDKLLRELEARLEQGCSFMGATSCSFEEFVQTNFWAICMDGLDLEWGDLGKKLFNKVTLLQQVVRRRPTESSSSSSSSSSSGNELQGVGAAGPTKFKRCVRNLRNVRPFSSGFQAQTLLQVVHRLRSSEEQVDRASAKSPQVGYSTDWALAAPASNPFASVKPAPSPAPARAPAPAVPNPFASAKPAPNPFASAKPALNPFAPAAPTAAALTAAPGGGVTPEIIATTAPDVIATTAPDVIATITPDVIATITPDVIATITPDVIATIAYPAGQSAPAVCTTTSEAGSNQNDKEQEPLTGLKCEPKHTLPVGIKTTVDVPLRRRRIVKALSAVAMPTRPCGGVESAKVAAPPSSQRIERPLERPLGGNKMRRLRSLENILPTVAIDAQRGRKDIWLDNNEVVKKPFVRTAGRVFVQVDKGASEGMKNMAKKTKKKRSHHRHLPAAPSTDQFANFHKQLHSVFRQSASWVAR